MNEVYKFQKYLAKTFSVLYYGLCTLVVNFHHIRGKHTKSRALFSFKALETSLDFKKQSDLY